MSLSHLGDSLQQQRDPAGASHRPAATSTQEFSQGRQVDADGFQTPRLLLTIGVSSARLLSDRKQT
ncbi:hypothetical protein D623_10014191 [Myotis brandtii]|uniref:Uncharacterized protein n=1 Tax=Myotis brandtii TaxID=109478 RepID=S7Q3J9_MYOBR|nr:hypothetical protein D623_10014191 [Myotis brandtii]